MRKKLLIAVLLLFMLVLLCWMYGKRQQDSTTTFSVDAVTEDEIKDELIIAAFIESIRNYVKGFYSEFYSGQIAVYNYEIDILEVVKTGNGLINIKFGVTPQIGAHNPLGYDELSYSVDSAGKGKLTKYQHIKNYPVPERFEEYIIKTPVIQIIP